MLQSFIQQSHRTWVSQTTHYSRTRTMQRYTVCTVAQGYRGTVEPEWMVWDAARPLIGPQAPDTTCFKSAHGHVDEAKGHIQVHSDHLGALRQNNPLTSRLTHIIGS